MTAWDEADVGRLPDVPFGARWTKVDLHLHSPGIPTFRLPHGVDVRQARDREQLAAEYVERLATAGIEVGAITDYQGVRPEFFGPIAERARQRGIAVLPGAEMSISEGAGAGLHLLVIAGSDTDPERLTRIIGRQGRDADPLFEGREPHKGLRLRGNLTDALTEIRREIDCVIVAAHADDENGVLRALKPQQTAELIRDGLVDALDCCEDASRRLMGTGVLSPARLDALACTLSSDPQSLDEVGTKRTSDGRLRATWLKLSAATPAALRFALHDRALRVRTEEPEPAHHPRILSLRVEGEGFLGGVELRFNDDLTTLVGGRGAGKSAVLEVVRHVLAGATYSDRTRRRDQVGAALGPGGRAHVIIERPGPGTGQRYAISRGTDDEPTVLDLADRRTLDVRPGTLFGPGAAPVVLLQGEVQAVAGSAEFRRTLLDEIVGDDARQADRAVAATLDLLRRNARALDGVEQKLIERDGRVEELHQLDAEIAYFDNQGVGEKLRRHADAGADRAALTSTENRLREVVSAQRAATSEISDGLAQVLDRLGRPRSEHAAVLTGLADRIRAQTEAVSAAHASALAVLDGLAAEAASETAGWAGRTAALDADLTRIRAELGGSTVDTGRYLRATERRTALRPIVDGLMLADGEQARLHGERDTLLDRVREQRREASDLRSRAARTINERLAGRLDVAIGPSADSDELGRALGALLRGSRVSTEAVQTIVRKRGTDGATLARAVRAGADEVQDRFGVTAATAQRLVEWLGGAPERLREVDVLAPLDRVSISLVTEGVPRDLDSLSGGQRATAVLLLMFAQGGRPLILDQPEDDLDNRFIYDDVVRALRAAKGVPDPELRRQVIVATHNANIPVNGDAELVLGLADAGGRIAVRTRSSLDDAQVRREVRTVLEGGAEAFARRAATYGGLDDPR